jgi:hypothetical protein
VLWLLLLFALGNGPLAPHGEKAVVLVFTRTDCPVSNRYAPEVEKLYKAYRPKGVDFWLVYPERDLSHEAIEHHRKEYAYSVPALPDPDHTYVARAHVTTTPEAAVFVQGSLVYHGRIDDRYIDFGKARQQPTQRDLDQVLRSVVAGEHVRPYETKAIGCAIADLR